MTKKAARTPLRQRKFIDLPGSNSCRGLSGLTLKSELHFGIQVTQSALKSIQESTEAAEARDGGDVEAAPLELLAEADPREAAEVAHAGKGLPWFCWSTGETFWREFLNLYSHENGPASTGVIDFTVGCGLLGLASARAGVRYCGFVLNEAHRDAVMQSLTVAVAVEISRNCNDGFLKRRMLSRERSLGGSTDADVIAQEAAAAAQTPTKGANEGLKDEEKEQKEEEKENAESSDSSSD